MENQTNEEKIVALRKALLKRKYFSIFLALFTLGVNIFAWFVFTTTAKLELDATVASWDVQFRDDSGEEMQSFEIDITKMKPGMDDYTKTITINNRSDVDADFIYEVSSFELLGYSIQMNDRAAMLNYLRNNYPFSVQFSASKDVLAASDEVQFDINLTWPYESETEIYYKQDDVYEYEPSLPYYRLSGGTYSSYNVSNSSTYESMKSRLYFAKDDADTYFGEKCHEYEDATGRACLILNLKLLVQQKNES